MISLNGSNLDGIEIVDNSVWLVEIAEYPVLENLVGTHLQQ